MNTTPTTEERHLTVVKTVNTMAQAEILKSLLQANGIPVLLAYESGVALQTNVFGSAVPVDLLTSSEQAAEARQILENFYAGRLEKTEEP